jgi:hypothetical protein
MDAPRPGRAENARRLTELHAEIELLRPRMRGEGGMHVPTAFREILKALAEAIALARGLDLGEEAERFEGVREEARRLALAALPIIVARAEAAVTRMYERFGATGAYSDAKDDFCDAIGLAKRLGLDDQAAKLDARLAEVKAVFRSQLS